MATTGEMPAAGVSPMATTGEMPAPGVRQWRTQMPAAGAVDPLGRTQVDPLGQTQADVDPLGRTQVDPLGQTQVDPLGQTQPGATAGVEPPPNAGLGGVEGWPPHDPYPGDHAPMGDRLAWGMRQYEPGGQWHSEPLPPPTPPPPAPEPAPWVGPPRNPVIENDGGRSSGCVSGRATAAGLPLGSGRLVRLAGRAVGLAVASTTSRTAHSGDGDDAGESGGRISRSATAAAFPGRAGRLAGSAAGYAHAVDFAANALRRARGARADQPRHPGSPRAHEPRHPGGARADAASGRNSRGTGNASRYRTRGRQSGH